MDKKKTIITATIAVGATAIALGAFFGISAGTSRKRINKYIEDQALAKRFEALKYDEEEYRKNIKSVQAKEHTVKIDVISKFKKIRVYDCIYTDQWGTFKTEHTIEIASKSSWLFFNEKEVVYSNAQRL